MNEVTTKNAPPQIYAGRQVGAIIPANLDECFRLSRAICMAGMVPDSYKGRTDEETASRVMMGVMRGAEVGLPPLAALANIYIVNNKPALFGDGALSVVQTHPQYAGHKEWFEGTEGQDSWVAKAEFYRREENGTITIYPSQFTWAQAKNANLTRRGPWVSYPARMLKMRARAFGLRDSFADALAGLAIAEEIRDIPVKAASVDTRFLDPHDDSVVTTQPVTAIPDPALAEVPGIIEIVIPEKPVDTSPRDAQSEDAVTINSKVLLADIKKSFVKIGDDAEKIKQAIAAAEGLALDEPHQSELNAILKAKREKVGIDG